MYTSQVSRVPTLKAPSCSRPSLCIANVDNFNGKFNELIQRMILGLNIEQFNRRGDFFFFFKKKKVVLLLFSTCCRVYIDVA